jgi:single-strand DNA-binding protein
MRTVNRVTLLGHVGSEPECKTTAGGKFIAKFSVATSYGKGDKEKTEWHRITCFEKSAEFVQQYVHKGDAVYVEGAIEYSKTDDENGKPRYWTDIIAREVNIVSSKKSADSPFD